MATSRWIRLDVSWFSSEWLDDLASTNVVSALLWPVFLCYVKAYGHAGRCRASAVGVLRNVTGVTRNDVTLLTEAAIKHGAVLLEGGDWVVVGWEQYQGDTTLSERMRRYRAGNQQLSAERNARNGDVALRNVTPVTRVTLTETVKEKKPSVSKRNETWRFCPPDWNPNDDHRQLASKLGVDFALQVASFRDHEFDKPKSDPDRSFRNWLRRAAEMQHRNGHSATKPEKRRILPAPDWIP